MNSAPVRIYDQSVTLIGEVADYVSLQYTRRWYTPGSFEFHVIPEEADRSLLQVKNLIQVGNSPERSGVITGVEWTDTDVKVTGSDIRFYLDQRGTIVPNGQDTDDYSGAAESVIIDLVKKNIYSSSDTDRNISAFSFDTSQGRGGTISFSTRLKTLMDEVTSIQQNCGLGTDIQIDYQNHRLNFKVLAATDRTQDAEEPYVFSPELRRTTENVYTEDITDYKNIVYVCGQGEGKDREIQIIGTGSGLNRFETIQDARDVGEDSDTTLEQRGNDTLSDHPFVQTFEPKVVTGDYQSRWDLGNYITVTSDKVGVEMDRQVTEVLEVYEDGDMTVTPTFGDPIRTIFSEIKNSKKSLNIITSSSFGGSSATMYYAETEPGSAKEGDVWV